MAANVLKSSLANQMSVFVVRAFIKMRGFATAHRELSQRFSELEKRVDMSDEKIQVILKAVRQLMAPAEKAPKKIGFKLREKRASYGKN